MRVFPARNHDTGLRVTRGSVGLICTPESLTRGSIGRSRTCVRVIRSLAGCAASLRTLLNLQRHPPLAVRSKLHTLVS